MKPRIVLLNPPGDKLYIRDHYCSLSSKANYYWAPPDLVVLSGLLAPHSELSVIDATVSRISRRDCAELVLSIEADALVFLTGHCSLQNDLSFVGSIRKQRDLVAVASGDIVMAGDDEVMEAYPFVDALLLDFTSPGIVEYLRQPRGLTSPIRDVRYRSADGRIVASKGSDRRRTFEIPVPPHELFPLTRYRLPYQRGRGVATVLTSLGCPYGCSFCEAGVIPFKWRPTENVVEELRYVRSLGVQEVYFKDSTFGANREVAVELCRAMIDEQLQLAWSCNCRVDRVDEELLSLMGRAGCYFVAFGVESGSPEVLAASGKGISLEDTTAAFARCRRLGLGTAAYFVVGLPGETPQTVRETVRFALALDPDYVSFAVASPDFGTSLRREVVHTPAHEQLANASDRSRIAFPTGDGLTPAEIEQWQQRAVRAFYLRPSYVLKRLKAVRNVGQARRLASDALALARNYLVPG